MTSVRASVARPRAWVGTLVRIAFGLVWVYAAQSKIRDPQFFLENIRSFRILEDPWAALVALGLPWLELACGVAVMVGRRLAGGALVVLAGSLLVFLVAIVVSWARGLDISCGCFGVADQNQSSYPTLVVRNLVLLAVNAYLIRRHLAERAGPAAAMRGVDRPVGRAEPVASSGTGE